MIGTRRRGVLESGGGMMRIVIRRLRCKKCKKIHHELPDIVIPYRRHSAATVEQIIGGYNDGLCCEGSTIRRIRQWWRTSMTYFAGTLASLREKYGVAFTMDMAPREIIRAVTNAYLWQHTRSAYMPG